MFYHLFESLVFYILAFFTLIFVSLGFAIFRKITKSKNVLVHALSFVPAVSSLMSAACLVGFFVLIDFFSTLNIGITSSSFLFSIIIPPLAVSVLGFFILKNFARRNLKKYIYTAYISVFFACGIFGTSLCLKPFIFPSWESVNVDNKFCYESQLLPLIYDEYNLRIKFNSGKILNIHFDSGGLCDYKLHELKSGEIFMEALHNAPSYIVDYKSEEIYIYKGGYMQKLNGEILSPNGTLGEGENMQISYQNDKTSSLEKSQKASKAPSIEDTKDLGYLNPWERYED